MKTTGTVTGIVSNLVTIRVDGPVAENEICFIDLHGVKMMAEVIKVNGDLAQVQVFESTRGLKNGDKAEFEGRMLEATLGPVFSQAYTTVCRTTLRLWRTYSLSEVNIQTLSIGKSYGNSPLSQRLEKR